jgi:heme-degrading monooxygenase HmoA
MPTDYIYVWEFRVAAGRREAFLEHYRADGTWARLFRRAAGYIGTELLHDRREPLRFLTVDRWQSELAYRQFREQFATDYAELDRVCEHLTEGETLVGEFAA